MMKYFLLVVFTLFPLAVSASANSYSSTTGRLFVKNVSIDGAPYSNVALTLRNNGNWTVDSVTPGSDANGAEYPSVNFDSGANLATFPTLDIDGASLQNVTLLLNPDGGWEMSLARATPVATPISPASYAGVWVNDQKGLKYSSAVSDGVVTLTNLRTGLIFRGVLNGAVATLVEDDEYLSQSATLTFSTSAATLHIESCQPKAQTYFCSKTLPVGTPVLLTKQ